MPCNRGISIPARPVPPTPKVNPSGPAAATQSGPRQPLPADSPRGNYAPLPPLDRPSRPAPPLARSGHAAATFALQSSAHSSCGAGSVHPNNLHSSVRPRRPAPCPVRPFLRVPHRRPAPRLASGLTPGAPIAPRPQGNRPLAGQPQARPIVPPRPDLVQRLKAASPAHARHCCSRPLRGPVLPLVLRPLPANRSIAVLFVLASL